MAGKFGSASAFLLVDGYDLLGSKVKNLTYKIASALEDTTGLGDSTKSQTPTGMVTLTVNQSGGFFDTSTNGAHTALVSVATSPQGAPRVLTLGFAGTAAGDPFTGAQGAYASGYEVIGKQGTLTKADPTYTISGQVDQGVILHAMAAKAADTTGTSVDGGAATTAGGAAILQVKSYTGLDSAVITVEDSANNSSFATIATFTTVTTGPRAERQAIGGTIRRYTRYVIDVTGTGSITFWVGLARG